MATDNPMRILFVEDLPSDMELAEHELRRVSIPFTSLRVETREGYLKALEEFQPDLIISDYALPEFDGMQALKLWRQQHPALPFIILTGSMNEETAVDCMKAGATDYVIKERIKRLPFAVQEALAQQRIRSEKEWAEQALRESEARFRKMLEMMPLPLCYVNKNGVITFRNKRFDQVFGYTAIDVPTLAEWWQHAYPDAQYRQWVTGTWDAAVKRAAEEGRDIDSIEYRVTCRSGEERIVEISGITLGDDFLATFIDITERKLAEAEKEKLRAQLNQSQKMETVGHLAGGIAHDFNNILAAIIGYADLLQTKMSADDPLYSNVEHILSSSERAVTLVHSLLAFSRKQTLSVKQIKINDLVSGVSKLLVRLLGEDVILETVFTFRDPMVMADAGQIDQILFNLATNARDAMPEGGHLTIITDIAEIDDTYIKEHGYGLAGDYALIIVSDTGAGMDRATQDKIFEPFFTTKEVGKGTGLGLSTAYGIVKQHNGFINCYSEPGKGTTFKIYLPLLESDQMTEGEQIGKITELMPRGNETILVAEDDVTVRELLIYILSQYGYTIYEAEDGGQAVSVFTEHAQEIDLLLFDIIMPRKNGKEAYQEIQNIRPGVPVLFTSGYTADIVHKKGFLDDGFELLLKPVSMTALLQKVREVLDINRQQAVGSRQ